MEWIELYMHLSLIKYVSAYYPITKAIQPYPVHTPMLPASQTSILLIIDNQDSDRRPCILKVSFN